ncbi:MAG: GEVED domain-containing protein, partial [Ferruginibacter sp.]
MQSKTTLKRIGGFLQKSLMILALFCFFAGNIDAQVFTNGNLNTGPTTSTGDPAPAGYNWSEVQTGNANAGYSASVLNGFSVADDFDVTCGTWDLTKFTCYSYSTGSTGTTSPITELRLQIFNTDPSVGAPTPIFGDLTTNRLTGSTPANLYRIFTGTAGTTRNIWKNEATIAISLAPGHYWVEWQVEVLASLTSNFSPASTVVGTVTQPGNNAQQHDLNANAWTPILDGPAAADPQDMPFRLDYITTVCTGTPAPGNTISSDATVCPGNSFTLSPQNQTCGSGVTYQWQSSADGITFTDIPGANNSTFSTTQNAATFYQVVVSCSGTPGPTSSVMVDLSPSNQCYCIPASSNCTDGDIITNVTLNTLNNTSDCEVDGFINYGADPTVVIPDLVQGIPNPISVTAGGGTYDEGVAVWIDYDHNGSFDASEFTSVGTTTGGTLLANINVPASAPLGQARMRVRVQFFDLFTAGDACTPATLGYGETEDYLVNIIPCVQGVFDMQPVSTSAVCGNNVSFTTSVTGSLITYQWQEKVGSGPWTNVVNGGSYAGATTN